MPMDERLRFIARLLEGEKMAPLCREFGISRVTGYKIYERYKTCGLDGLNDRSRRPYRHANKLPYQVERTILGIRKRRTPFPGRRRARRTTGRARGLDMMLATAQYFDEARQSSSSETGITACPSKSARST